VFEELAAEITLSSDTGGAEDAAAALSGVEDSAIGVKNAIGAAGGALAAAAAGGIAEATSAAISYESQMADVEKVTSEVAANDLEDSIQNLATEIPIATDELATLAEQAGKFGAEGTDEINQFVETVGQIQTATDLAADQAGKRFAKIAGAIDMPLTEIDKLGNATNALADSMKTDAGEITDTATRAANVLSQQFGLGEDAVIALSASMNEVSPSSRKAAGGLQRAAEALMNPKKVEDIAGALGITTDEFRNMREEDPEELFRQVAEQVAGSGDAARDLSTVLGKRATRAFSKLGGQADRTDEAIQKVNDQFEDGTSLSREMSIRTETFEGKLQLLKNQLGNVARSIGDVFLPPLTDLLGYVSDVVERFQTMNDESDGLVGALGLVGTAIGATGAALATLVSGPLGLAVTAIGTLATAFATDFAGIRTTVENAIGAVSEELNFLIDEARNVVAGVRQAFQSFSEGDIAGGFRTLRDTAVDFIQDIGAALFGEGGSGGGIIDTAIGGLADWLKGTAPGLVGQAFRIIGESIRAVLLDIKAALSGEDSIIGDAIGTVVSYLKTDAAGDLREAAEIAFDLLLTGVSNLLQGLTGSDSDASIQSMVLKATGWLTSTGKTVLRTAGETAFDAVIQAGNTLADKLIRNDNSVVKSFIADIKAYFTSGQALDNLKAGAEALGRGIRDTFEAYFKLREKIGKVIVDWIGDVYEYIASGEAYEDITEAFRLLAEGIITVAATYFKLREKIGKVIVDWIGDVAEYIGSGEAYNDITTAFDTLLGAVVDIFQAFVDGLFYGSLIKDFFNDFASYVGEGGGGFGLITGAFGVLIDAIKAVFTAYKKFLIGEDGSGGIIGTIASGIGSFIGEGGGGYSTVTSAFGDLVGAVETLFSDFKTAIVGENGSGGLVGTLASGIENTLDSIDVSGVKSTLQGVIDKAAEAISKITDANGMSIDDGSEDNNEEDDGDDGDGSSDDGGNISAGSGDNSTGGTRPGSSVPNNLGPGGPDSGDDQGMGPVNETEGGGTIPGFASGGLVTGPTTALIGEGSEDEFVAPRSTMERELRRLADKVVDRSGGDGIVIEEIYVDADSDMNERELVRAVKTDLGRELRRLETR